jgi:hypothetical protein
MLTSHVKVVFPNKKAIFLEKAKYVDSKSGVVFLSGYQVSKDGDAVIVKGAEQMHLIQLGSKDANGMFKLGQTAPTRLCPGIQSDLL